MLVVAEMLWIWAGLRGTRLTQLLRRPVRRPWEVLLVDQRCHGASAHRPELRPPHTIQSSAADMTQLAKQARPFSCTR